ncbi:hypothetical protein SAMN05192533_12165 [Mesobacillus persicus]|uniref:Uncharacterized protein n=2 Tax=Mesobacillus persicus TaxID=930146 RepID=A0A1H8JKI1_9BACI|nr:hypothetical protein SAMN05192533_12165 [Mesobacillus persicus]
MVVVSITIRYKSPAGIVLKQGLFPIRGQKPELVAWNWWQQIKLETYTDELIEVIVNGELDITDKVRELKKPLLTE